MELSVAERLILLSVLPEQGDFTTLKLVRDLRESLSFSEEEHKVYAFAQEGMKIKWNYKAEQSKEVDIKEKATTIIAEALRKLNEEKKLKMEHFSVYEKFIENNNGGV